jgi:hypothetical protein
MGATPLESAEPHDGSQGESSPSLSAGPLAGGPHGTKGRAGTWEEALGRQFSS